MTLHAEKLQLKCLGINTYTEPVIYIREDSHICSAEGFQAQARVMVTLHDRSLIATLNTVQSELLHRNEASLSTYAWHFLQAQSGDIITVSHAQPLESLRSVHAKLYGKSFTAHDIHQIMEDLVAGRLSDIDISMFLSASAAQGLNERETLDLTNAMVKSGQSLSWPSDLIVDKHCIGGLPGNRTTLVVVPIVAAFGLMIPKTSSRAITSPAGTADTMEVFAPVNLDIKAMRRVVERENGCIVWGGSVSLSPADDLLIRIERSMNLDSEGQLVASILSKKIAAGSSHLLVDIPVGPTAKIHTVQEAQALKRILEKTAESFAIKTKIIITDGRQPVGRGIGPALEARDILAVLRGDPDAPEDLRDRALTIAGHIIEFSPTVSAGAGKNIARALLESGKALQKFEAICHAQGGFCNIPMAPYQHTVAAKKSGKIMHIDNNQIARLAKLAGAPTYKAAGVVLLQKLHATVRKNEPLLIVYAEAKGALDYALSYLERGHSIFHMEEE